MAEFFKARNIPYLVCNGYKCLFSSKFIELLNDTKIHTFTVCKLYLRECLPKKFLKTCLLKIFPFFLLTHHPGLDKNNPGCSGEIEICGLSVQLSLNWQCAYPVYRITYCYENLKAQCRPPQNVPQ